MIAVDTSALMAIALNEKEADACIAAGSRGQHPDFRRHGGRGPDRGGVAARRNVGDEVGGLIDGLGFDIVAVTPASARRIALAYAHWGKGMNPAALNFGDCFAYAVAKENSCRLLYVGDDFSKTDIAGVL